MNVFSYKFNLNDENKLKAFLSDYDVSLRQSVQSSKRFFIKAANLLFREVVLMILFKLWWMNLKSGM